MAKVRRTSPPRGSLEGPEVSLHCRQVSRGGAFSGDAWKGGRWREGVKIPRSHTLYFSAPSSSQAGPPPRTPLPLGLPLQSPPTLHCLPCHRSISAHGTTLSERCLQNQRREAQSRGRVMEGKEKPLQTRQGTGCWGPGTGCLHLGTEREVRSWDRAFPRAELGMRFIPPCLDVSRWVPQDTGRAQVTASPSSAHPGH